MNSIAAVRARAAGYSLAGDYNVSHNMSAYGHPAPAYAAEAREMQIKASFKIFETQHHSAMNSSNNTIRPFRPIKLPAFGTGKPAICPAGLKPSQRKCGPVYMGFAPVVRA